MRTHTPTQKTQPAAASPFAPPRRVNTTPAPTAAEAPDLATQLQQARDHGHSISKLAVQRKAVAGGGGVVQMNRWKKALKYGALGVGGAIGGVLAAPVLGMAAATGAVGGGLLGLGAGYLMPGGQPQPQPHPQQAALVHVPAPQPQQVVHMPAPQPQQVVHMPAPQPQQAVHVPAPFDPTYGITPPSHEELEAQRRAAEKSFRRRQRLQNSGGGGTSNSNFSADTEDVAPTAASMADASARMTKTHGGGKPHGKAASRPKARQAEYDRNNARRAAQVAAQHQRARLEREAKEEEKKKNK